MDKMTQSEFDILSNDLRALAVKIPLHWGAVQNNRVDDNINMFAINSYAELERQISHLSDDKKTIFVEDGIFGNAQNATNIFSTKMTMSKRIPIVTIKLGMSESMEALNLTSKELLCQGICEAI